MLDECHHGSLRRQCEICERDDRIAELEAALRPFSVFHAALVKLLGGASPKNADFYTIQAGVEAAVTLRIEDFAAAAKHTTGYEA